MDQKKIGGFLRELRKSAGFTQEQAAEKLGISSRTISRWETGAYMPDISMLVDIAELYDVDIREIIDGERKEENMNREVKEVAEKMADYSTMEKNNIFKWFKMMGIGTMIISLCLILLNCIRPFAIHDMMPVFEWRILFANMIFKMFNGAECRCYEFPYLFFKDKDDLNKFTIFLENFDEKIDIPIQFYPIGAHKDTKCFRNIDLA